MSRLQTALDQIRFSRAYTLRLLETIPMEAWFQPCPGGVTHIAWQVGHLAMAEYRLALERLRPRTAKDEALISDSFLALFGRDSVPNHDPAKYPSAAEIRAVFDAVHEQAMDELPSFPDADLDSLTLKPHSLVKTKLWALIWCAQHEMVHAGQIALIRRMNGQKPIW